MHKIIIVLTLFCILSCTDKKEIHPELRAESLEKFDLKRFKANKKDSIYEYIIKDTIVKLYEGKNYYKKELSDKNHSFKHIFVYDKPTNLLVNESNYFYGMPIGVWTKYDEKGALIDWINYDEGFDFTIQDLIAMFKKDLQIDLIKNNGYHSLVINRSFYKKIYFTKSPCYVIEITKIEGTRTIQIDGKTGKIVSDQTAFIEE